MRGFGRLPQTTPKLYWKNPKLFKLLGFFFLHKRTPRFIGCYGFPIFRPSQGPCPRKLALLAGHVTHVAGQCCNKIEWLRWVVLHFLPLTSQSYGPHKNCAHKHDSFGQGEGLCVCVCVSPQKEHHKARTSLLTYNRGLRCSSTRRFTSCAPVKLFACLMFVRPLQRSTF